MARGVAGGQGCSRWPEMSPVAKDVSDKPVARGVARGLAGNFVHLGCCKGIRAWKRVHWVEPFVLLGV
jgi:hypothetical protein